MRRKEILLRNLKKVQLEWIREMNNIENCVMEIILKSIIYFFVIYYL